MAFKHGQVVGQHFPVELLADVLVSPVLFVLLLPCVVGVAVEQDELVPLLEILAHMIHILLAHLQKVLTTRKVIKHYYATDFVEKLLLEVLTLVKQLLDLLSSLGQHQVLGFLVVVSDFVQFFDQCGVLHLPCLVVLLFEQSIFFLLEELLGTLEFEFRALNKQKRFLETSSTLLSLIFELRVQSIVNHEALVDGQLSSHSN